MISMQDLKRKLFEESLAGKDISSLGNITNSTNTERQVDQGKRRFIKYIAAGAVAAGVGYVAAKNFGLLKGTEYTETTNSKRATTEYTYTEATNSKTATTESIIRRIKIPDNGCYLGAAIPDGEDFNQFENEIGKKMAIRNSFWTFEHGTTPFEEKQLTPIIKNDNVPMISWEPVLLNKKKEEIPIKLQDIIDGKYDEHLTRCASKVKTFEHTIFLRPAWEMNGSWTPYSGANNFGLYGDKTWKEADDLYKYYGDPKKADGPERYVDAWRRIRKVFDKTGANNIEWVWSTASSNYPQEIWNVPENYYPGDEYVDWVGVSLYNHGWIYEKKGWFSFDTLFSRTEPIRVYNMYRHKPFMLAEWGCGEGREYAISGDKAKWITEAFDVIKNKYSNIKAAVWFSKDKSNLGDPSEKDWRIDSSPQALQTYVKSISDPYFLDHVTFEPVISHTSLNQLVPYLLRN